MKVKVNVTLKTGVLDPQGKAVESVLEDLGFVNVRDVRIGRYIELELDVPDLNTAQAQSEQMCKTILANPVIEDYNIEIVG